MSGGVARTRSKDYGNIRASIIERTAALFADRGYAATSIGDIATACECSKSRLYHYFDSKEAILAEMLSEHVDVLLEGCHRVLQENADPIVRFRVLVEFFLEVYAGSANKHIVMLTCIRFLPEETQREVIRKQRELVAFIRDIIGRLRPEAGKQDALIHVDTMLFFGMINWTYTWYDPEGKLSPKALADRSVELFLNGYRNLPETAGG